MKTIFELASGDTTSTTTRGTSRTAYALEPTIWAREIIDAAKKRHIFAQYCDQRIVSPGNRDIIIPYRSLYLESSDWASSASEGASVTFTKIDNLDGVQISPADANYGVALSNRAVRINALDLIKAAKDELVFRAGDVVDVHVRDTLGDATAATASVSGAQTEYGGNARADSELATGDTLTTDMISDIKVKLQSTICTYWVPGTPQAEANCSAAKNPWVSTPQEPFVLALAVEQEGLLLKDSQFVNAAEFGGREALLNGFIAKYLGFQIVTSPNVESFSSGGTSPDGGSAAGAAGHRCLAFKARRMAGLGWGLKPNLKVFDYPSQLEKRLVLELAYQAAVIHNDAIVFVDVTDV